MRKFVLVALVAALLAALPVKAAAQSTTVTVSSVAQLQAAVVAATGSTSPVDIRIKAGTYDLPSSLELSVATGATATLRNFGDGQVILTAPFRILRTGFVTGQGAYIVEGLTLASADTAIEHDGGDIRIEASTFYDNVLGFYADRSTANITILNSTFWMNGVRCGEGSSNCGAIWLDFYRSAALTNLTVAGAGNGVGIYGLGNESVGPTRLANSMIVFNQWNCTDGGPNVLGANNIVDETGSPCAGSTVVEVGFQVPGFGDHGGLVPTWPLTWDATVPQPNPAIRSGAIGACPSHDARGAIRQSFCDIGAYETSPSGFTLDSATGAGEVTFEAPPGQANFVNFHAIDPSRLPQAGLPPGVTLPFGVFEWTAVGLSLGQSLPVTITFPTDISSTSSLQYWKFDPASGQWADLCLQLTCAQPSPNVLSFTITDGGVGDLDGVVNGSIRDPGGLGVGGDQPSPNLTITKSLVGISTVQNGDSATYRLTVSNTGNGSTTGSITVTDILDPRLSFVVAGSSPRCGIVGSEVTCIANTAVTPGASDSFDLVVQVAADAAPIDGSVQIVNTAWVSTAGDTNAADDRSNTVALTVQGPQRPNLTITKSLVGPSTVNNGESATYRLTVSNTGGGPTTGPLTVTDALDSNLGFVAAGSDSRCLAAGQLTQVVTCVATGVVAAGASDSFDVVVQAAANAAPIDSSIQISNTAVVSTAGDSNGADDLSNSVVLTVRGPHYPNLTVSQVFMLSGNTVPPNANTGDTVVFRLSVANLGSGPTTAPILITDILDPRLSFVATGGDPQCSAAGQTVTCSSAIPIDPNGVGQFDITVRVADNVAPPGGSLAITNTAVVSTLNDSNPTDDASTLVLTVHGPPAPNMMITKQFVAGGTPAGTQLTVNNGEEVGYRLLARNVGVGTTTGPIAVTDILDGRLAFIAARSDSRCSAAGQVVTCIAQGPLSLNGSSTSDAFDIRVQVALDAAPFGTGQAQVNNTATVSTPYDSDPADDTSNTAVLTVVGQLTPNAQLQKRFLVGGNPLVGPITVYQGATVTYQLQVINAGFGPTNGPTVVTDSLDPRLSFVSAGSDPRCSAAGQVVTCVATSLIPAGGADAFDVVAHEGPNIVATGNPIEIFNSATVSTPNDIWSADDNSNTVALVVLLGASTPSGFGVPVQPTDDLGMPQPIQLFFHNVTSPGFTTAIPLPVGPALPPNFQLRGQMYDITTTAQYDSTITLCFFGGPFLASDRLLHYENGNWVELANQQFGPSGGPYTELCAETMSLSPFAVGSVINTPPTLWLPANIAAEATGAAGASVTFTVSAGDAEDGPLTPTCTLASGALFPIGVTTVDCTATDMQGASASGAFTVTVADTTPPAIATPAPITQTATDSNGVAVSFTVTASDLVSGSLTPACAPASGSVFAIGTTTVTCSAQDAAGNDATAAFTVTVLAPPNEQAPTLTRITPDSGKRGTFQVVFLRGTGLRKKPTVRFSGEGIRVIEEVSVNATTTVALIFIKPNAERGPRAVTVSNAFGTSNSLTFVVR